MLFGKTDISQLCMAALFDQHNECGAWGLDKRLSAPTCKGGVPRYSLSSLPVASLGFA